MLLEQVLLLCLLLLLFLFLFLCAPLSPLPSLLPLLYCNP